MQRPTRPILVLCSALLLGCSSLPVTSETRDSEISQILLKAEAAWAQVDVTNDKSVFQHIIAPDFVATGSESGKLKNRQQWLADWEYEGTQSTAQSDMRVHIFAANVAVVTGIQISVGDKEGPASRHEDRFTDTWVKRKEVWQCVAAHVTRLILPCHCIRHDSSSWVNATNDCGKLTQRERVAARISTHCVYRLPTEPE